MRSRRTGRRDWLSLMAAVVILAAALIFAPHAGATGRPAPPQGYGALAVELADDYWGGPPTNCTSETWTFDATQAQTYGNPAVGTEATRLMPCVAYVAPQESLYALCLVVLHEDGHLHGLGHVADPHAVMYGEPYSEAYGASPWLADVQYCHWFEGNPRTAEQPASAGPIYFTVKVDRRKETH